MCSYLDQVGATYYFRRAVPQELRSHFRTATGKPRFEFKFSLHTKDRETAKRLLPDRVKETDKLFDEARAQLVADENSASYSATDWGSESAAFFGELSIAKEARQRARQPIREQLAERLDRFSTAELPPREAAMKDLLREAREPQALPAVRYVALLETFDSYVAAQGMKANTAKEWRAIVQRLIEFLKHDDAARITASDLHNWRDHLLSEMIDGHKCREPRTVRGTYFAAIRATLSWAVEAQKLPRNVALEVKVRVPKKAKLRSSDFTDAEARKILTASLVPANDKLSAGHVSARRWIPWLCAYTGARVNEFSQLRGEDVQKVDGIWTVRITPEAGTVKSNSARVVPLHSHLVDQGFLEFAQAKGKGPLFYDPALRRVESDDNRHFKKVGERLADWVRNDVGISDPAVRPNHGWRHTFKTIALAANITERIADAIQGHAAKTVGQAYGSVPLKTLAEAIEKLPRFKTDPSR